MTFRARLTLVAAAAVALAVVLASALVFVVVRGQLRGQIDDALHDRGAEIARVPLRQGRGRGGEFFDIPGPQARGRGGLRAAGRVGRDGAPPPGSGSARAVTQRVLDVADGEAGAFFIDATVNGTHVRVLTFPYGPGYAAQVRGR